MRTEKAIGWLQKAPFSLDMLAAIAYQETGYIWWPLASEGTDANTILEVCVGDTLDIDKGRRAFPQTKDALLSVSRGDQRRTAITPAK